MHGRQKSRCVDCGGLSVCPLCEQTSIGPARRDQCPCCLQRCGQCGARVCAQHFVAASLILELDDEIAPVHPRGSCADCVDAERDAVDAARMAAWNSGEGLAGDDNEPWHVF